MSQHLADTLASPADDAPSSPPRSQCSEGEKPELERDELLVGWSGEHDPQNPVNWSKARKWQATGFACFMCFMCGINALSISSAASEINDRFGVSDATFPNSYWTVTSWNLGAAAFPIFVLPLLEDFGLRMGYLLSYTLFVIFIIPQAVTQNYATLIVARFFAGGFASVVQNSVENVIGDLWVGAENSLAVTVFIFAYLGGFTFGPVFGAAIASALSWRWIFYISLILYGALLIPALLLIPETRGTVILARKARLTAEKTGRPTRLEHQSTTSLTRRLYDSSVRPAHLFFTEPVVFFFTLWCAIAIGNVFLATQSILYVYSDNYAFSEISAGYIQAAMLVGELIGVPICLYQNAIYLASASKNPTTPGVPIPEHRLQLSIPGSVLGLGGGLLIYAWTSFPSLPWIAPTIGLGVVGVGVMIVVQTAATYITDAYGVYAGSAIAAVACVENLVSGLLPLAAQALYARLGLRWASTLLGFIALLLSLAPLVLYIKGPVVRARSPFMSSL